MTKIKKCKYGCFNDIKNLLNYKSYNKLASALKHQNALYFKKIVNGNMYSFKVQKVNGIWGVVIRNITVFSSYALLIREDIIINTKYTDFNI